MPIPGTFTDPKKKLTDDPGAIPDSTGTTPPVRITSVSSGTPSGGSATITWTTSQAASSKVSYGLATIGRSQTTSETDTNPTVTSHSVTLSGLTAGKTYAYRVHSRLSGGHDGAGNSVMDGYQFTQDSTFVAA